MVRTIEQLFDAPVPGQSLTRAPKSANYESPPKYTDVDQAAEDVWERLKDPRQALKIKSLLERGAPVEALARTIVFGGFSEGAWTPDVGLMLEPIVGYQIAAIGKLQGLEDPLRNNPVWADKETTRFIASGVSEELPVDEALEMGEDRTGLPVEVSPEEEVPTEEFRGILSTPSDVGGERAMAEDFTSAPVEEELPVVQ